MVNAGGAGYKSVEQTHSDQTTNRNWLPRFGKITDPFPMFDYDAILNKELDELIARERSWRYDGEVGGEGIDPNIFEKEVERFQKEMAPLAVAWWSSMDVATWHRTTEVRKFTP